MVRSPIARTLAALAGAALLVAAANPALARSPRRCRMPCGAAKSDGGAPATASRSCCCSLGVAPAAQPAPVAAPSPHENACTSGFAAASRCSRRADAALLSLRRAPARAATPLYVLHAALLL
jgi:hypothetical protein